MQQVYRTSYRVLHKVSVGPAFNFSGGTNKEAQVTINNNMGQTITYVQKREQALWRMDFGLEAIYRL